MLTWSIAALLVTLSAQGQPPAVAQPAGTGTIRGQVTDADSGAPLPRAVVTIRLPGRDARPRTLQHITDADGRFEFRSLSPGANFVSATGGEHRATYVTGHFPPRSPSGAGPALLLKEGETRGDVTIALRRALAISGRVVDELGAPLAGVEVELQPAAGGYPRSYVRSRTTDDRGLFRLFGVPPGEYVVCADMQHRRTMPPGVVAPGAPQFVNTCYPSALSPAEAQAVTVTAADVAGIDIVARRSRTYAIAGQVVDSGGELATAARIVFHRYRRDGGSSGDAQGSEGRFRVTGLVPGDYAVEAFIGGRADALSPFGATERGYVAVTIADADVDDLVVAMRRPATVQGRVMFEDGQPAGRGGGTISIQPVSAGRGYSPPMAPVPIDENLSFTLSGIFDPVCLNVSGLPDGWVVKSIRYKGQDVADAPAELVTDPRHVIEITLTGRVAMVAGTVTDDSGKPATGARVFLLPPDPKRWRDDVYRYGAAAVMRDGRFTTRGVPAGDYLIVATTSDLATALAQQRQSGVERLAKHAERISLTDNDRLTMNLRLVTMREVR